MDFLEKSIIFLTRVGKMLKGGKSGFFRVGLLEFSRHSIAFVYHVFVCLIYYICKIDFLGSREESDVSGFFVFSHIWMMGYSRLGSVRVNEYPQG